jgi:Na+/proline symporter
VLAAVLLAVIHLLRLVALLVTHRTLQRIIDRHPDQAQAMLDKVGTVGAGERADDRTGMLLVAAGIAMILGSVIVNDPAWVHYGAAAALFPLLMGTALWLRDIWEKRQARGQ